MNNTGAVVDVFNRLAGQYQDKYMDTGLYHSTFDLFCSSIKVGDACVLDVACGPGNITHYLLSKMPALKILGIDLAPNMLRLAEINNPSASFLLADCRDIRSFNRKFDAIMCGFCLPYLSQEECIQLINDAATVLNTGGILYISTMEGNYSDSGFQTSSSGDQMHIYYHEADYLLTALTDNGFSLIDLQRIIYPGADGATITDIVLIARI